MAPAAIVASSTTFSTHNSMLRRASGGFSLLSPSNSFISSSPLFSLCFNWRPSLSSFSPLKQTYSNSPSIFRNCDGNLRVNGRKGGAALVEKGESDDTEENFDFDDDFFGVENGEEEDDEGVILPFDNMRKWLENKPSGFGEGKSYDTSLEDKLFDEMRQSRQAQLANVNKLKHNPINPNLKKKEKKEKAPEVTKSDFRVRLINLPKKRNIQRDLKAAFEGVPGIIDISPAVSGNKKTKDPICKGFAFVHFKSEGDAIRFVQRFSGHSVEFGRVSKQIKCEMANATSPGKTPKLANGLSPGKLPILADALSPGKTPKLAVAETREGSRADSDTYNSSSALSVEDLDNDFDMEMREEDITEMRYESDTIEMKIGKYDMEKGDGSNEIKMASATSTNSRTKSVSSPKMERVRPTKKKLVAKEKQQKVPKQAVLGSAKRLKFKEKAVLTGVFSKYGANTTTALKKKP